MHPCPPHTTKAVPLRDTSSFIGFLPRTFGLRWPGTVARPSLRRVRRVIAVRSAVGPVRVAVVYCAGPSTWSAAAVAGAAGRVRHCFAPGPSRRLPRMTCAGASVRAGPWGWRFASFACEWGPPVGLLGMSATHTLRTAKTSAKAQEKRLEKTPEELQSSPRRLLVC